MGLTKVRLLALVSTLLLSSCVSTQFSLVSPGAVMVGNLSMSAADGGWNRAPGIYLGGMRDDSELWTRDGLPLDRLLIIPAVGNGGTLFVSNSDALVFPAFEADMLPNEIVELTQSSLAKYYGVNTAVEAGGLRPHRLGERRAVMFDLEATPSEAPAQQGRVLAFVEDDELYLMIYIATELYYFDKHWDAALQLMESATVAAGGA